jgi:hypothetical protein
VLGERLESCHAVVTVPVAVGVAIAVLLAVADR